MKWLEPSPIPSAGGMEWRFKANRTTMKHTIEQQAKILGVSVDQIRAQHRKNALGLREMQSKALVHTTGKNNGYTASQLDEMARYSETV